jgi:lactoylglutathione lyase
MERVIAKLLKDFENGQMSRRQLIQSLALAATAASAASAKPKAANAASKGFKAVAWNHLSYDVTDVAKTRDFYVDLFGMRTTWDDGKQSELDFGNPSAVDSLYIRKVKPGNKVSVDHLAWSVEDFTKDGSEAQLKQLGLSYTDDGPVAWNVKDPDGFTTQIVASTGGWPGGAVKGAKIEDGQKNLANIPVPSGKGFKAIGAVVYLYVTDIARSRDFYTNLYGMKVSYYQPEEECFLRFGGNDGFCLRKSQRSDNKAYVDHFSILVANYNKDAVEGELKRRGLDPQPDTKFAWRIHDPEGYTIAVGGKGLLMGKEASGA